MGPATTRLDAVSDTKTFEQAELRLAEHLPGYESRPQQQLLAKTIEEAIADGTTLLAEAGCGTGKSVAYLIPAILSAKGSGTTVSCPKCDGSGKFNPDYTDGDYDCFTCNGSGNLIRSSRAVVSTATKALQDQIANKDLPFLKEYLGVDFTYTVVKGRSNYVCRAKVVESDEPRSNEVQVFISKKDDEADDAEEEGITVEPFSGERDDFPFEISNREWSDMTASGDECPGAGSCAFGDECYAEKVKARAKESDITVVNHALFFTDLLVKIATGGNASMIGEYGLFVADEAHELDEWATNMLGMRLSEGSIDHLIGRVRKAVAGVTNDQDDITTVNNDLLDLQDAVTKAWSSVNYFRPEANKRGFRDSTWKLDGSFLIAPAIRETDEPETVERKEKEAKRAAEAMESWMGLLDSLRLLLADLKAVTKPAGATEEEKAKLSRVVRMVSSMSERILTLLKELTSDEPSMVAWAETETFGQQRRERTVVRTAPIEVGDWLADNLWPHCTPILTSATMSIGGSFDFIATRLGLNRSGFGSIDVGTPFDYERQARIFVPSNLSSPKASGWVGESISTMARLVNASDGSALLLFTANGQMRKAHSTLVDTLPYTCLMQGEQPNKVLAETFMADKQSVLFGSKSFMTGVDFQGDACKLVVIDKLPFPVPTDPVIEAKCARIERNGGNSFTDFVIPTMSLILKQAFGRLIRHRGDHGVVAILDSRLVNERWGKKILNGLPDAPVITSEPMVAAFYAEAAES